MERVIYSPVIESTLMKGEMLNVGFDALFAEETEVSEENRLVTFPKIMLRTDVYHIKRTEEREDITALTHEFDLFIYPLDKKLGPGGNTIQTPTIACCVVDGKIHANASQIDGNFSYELVFPDFDIFVRSYYQNYKFQSCASSVLGTTLEHAYSVSKRHPHGEGSFSVGHPTFKMGGLIFHVFPVSFRNIDGECPMVFLVDDQTARGERERVLMAGMKGIEIGAHTLHGVWQDGKFVLYES